MELKFYRCKRCGNIVAVVKNGGGKLVCCGEAMEEIIAGTVEASKEKHIPVYTVNGNEVTVRIGSVDHPMQDVHYIEWVVLQTKFGNQRRTLNPNDAPEVKFALLPNDEVVAVYAYCNLHGLWKA
jgi:superoxide reductase